MRMSYVKCENIVKIENQMEEIEEEENGLDCSTMDIKAGDELQMNEALYKLERKRKFQHLKCKKSISIFFLIFKSLIPYKL